MALAILTACQGFNVAQAAEGDGLKQVQVVGNYDNSVGSSDVVSQGTVNGFRHLSRRHANQHAYPRARARLHRPNFIIPELVDRIDYKKGPFFVDEGDFPPSGAAHMCLANTLPQGIASLSVGGYGCQRALLADSVALGAGNLLFGLEVTRHNGPWDTLEGLRKYSGTLRYSGGTKTDGYEVAAMVFSNNWNSTGQVPLRAVQSG